MPDAKKCVYRVVNYWDNAKSLDELAKRLKSEIYNSSIMKKERPNIKEKKPKQKLSEEELLKLKQIQESKEDIKNSILFETEALDKKKKEGAR